MTTLAGIVMALVGLAIAIVAFVSFVYPLPGLTTNRGRGWTVVSGYCVLLWGSIIIRQTVPEEIRESFVTYIMLVPYGAFILSIIALIRPLPSCWMPTRKQARYGCALTFGLLVAISPLAPESPPPTSEELAAMAAEAKREEEEAEARRKVEERERAVQEVEDRREAIREWGEDHIIPAKTRCEERIEQLAKYDFEWTQGWGKPIFSQWIAHDPENPQQFQLFPPITESTILVYSGDKIKFQNGFGVFQHYTYTCHYHPDSKTVRKVTASPGRLN